MIDSDCYCFGPNTYNLETNLLQQGVPPSL